MSNDFNNRFGGTRRLYGEAATERLRRARICVVGIGGVGSWAAEALARTAVGHITLIDMDELCVTNTNRQIHALSDTVGRSKVAVMAERIRQINPDCACCAVEEFVTEDSLDLLDNQFDFVIDAIDSIRAKAAMIAYCRRRKIPIITIGGAGGQVDPTQIQVADLSRTEQDPLAAKLRSQLRRFHGFSKNSKRRFDVPCVYSSEQLVYPQPDGTVCAKKPVEQGSARLDCNSGFGAATVVTATFGFVAVARVIERLTRVAR